MKRAMFAAVALSAALAIPAFAGVQQPTPQQRRDIEKRMTELEREMNELREQLGDGNRERARLFSKGPQVMRIGPGGEVWRVLGRRMKFGFGFEAVPDSGVRVTTVTPGSPAEKVGIRAGDVISMFNGVKLNGIDDPDMVLQEQAENLEVGDTVGVEFSRAGERKSGKMVAQDLGPNPMLGMLADSVRRQMTKVGEATPGMFEWGTLSSRWMDIELVSLNPELGEYFGTPEGVLVVRTPRDSGLALRSGDVILSIDGRKPTTPPQALRILRSYEPGESFEIVVLRQKKKVTLTGRVPAGGTRTGYFYEYGNPEPAHFRVSDEP